MHAVALFILIGNGDLDTVALCQRLLYCQACEITHGTCDPMIEQYTTDHPMATDALNILLLRALLRGPAVSLS